MMRSWLGVCAVAGSLLVLGPAAADERIVKLASLEWPPYTGQALPDQGALAAIARAAFAAEGYRLQIDFYPWSRALFLAQKPNSEYAGYFPEYAAESLRANYILSESLGSGPLGFAERKDAPVPWTRLDDLATTTIGVVQNYINTDEFDARSADGRLNVEAAATDAINLRKTANRRVTLAVIDQNVMAYLLTHQPELADVRDELQFNARKLEDKQLYICFRKGPEGERLARHFNAGLKKIDAAAIAASHMPPLPSGDSSKQVPGTSEIR